MKLYLLRHAESEDGPREDPTRPLTAHGEAQARIMAEFLRREIGRADIVLSSYFKRARDTAAPIAEALGAPVADLWQLQPDGQVGEALQAIRRHATGHTVVVTHHPLVNELLKELTGCDTDEVGFHHGHCAHIHHNGKLRWFVGPGLVGRDEAVTEAAIVVVEAMLDSLRFTESAARRSAALEKPYARAARAIKRHWEKQCEGMSSIDLFHRMASLTAIHAAFREADPPVPDIEAQLRTALSGVPTDQLIADLFDDALAAALAAAAEHIAHDFAYADADALSTFEARYLANNGFQKITGGIDATTSKQVAADVAKAYQNGANYQGIVDTIRHTFADFEDRRLNLIAQTELNQAYNAGLMEFGRDAGATLKAWATTSENPCPSCTANEAAGMIPIEQAFPSGAMMPNEHPNCYCSLEVHA
jgi:phosphohistidine phosphatase